jgi:hypothetical protein
MSRTSNQTARTERFARRFAAGVTKNKMPAPIPALEDYLDRFPEDVLVALKGFVEHLATGGVNDSLVIGHLLLIQCQLEHIRYRKDRGYEDAIRLIETFQQSVANLAVTGRITGQGVSMVASALHQAGIAASAELNIAMTQCCEDLVSETVPPDCASMLEEVATQCGGDPFLVADLLAETGHAIPSEARVLMAIEQVRSANASAREAAVLLVLDAEPTVRQAAAAELQARPGGLSPDSLRRLITIRNWCPEAERPLVDAIVRAARTKGIVCATWQETNVEAILASCIDGSGAQGFLILSPAGKRKQLSSVLLKNGVRDAWTAPPETPRKLRSTLADAAIETSMMPVSRAYFDRAVRHHLHLGLAAAALPPAGLLQVAETIGGAQWQPELLEWRKALAARLGELPAASLKPHAVNVVLRTSAAWADFDSIVESWFEDDQDVARLVSGVRGGQRAKTAEYLLQNVLVRRREKWAELFLWTALWLREASDGDALPWQNFAILAHALARGHDLADIPLMRDIAARTVGALPRA